MSNKIKSLLYVFTRAPYSNSVGQEGLDAVLVGASFEQNVSVLFLHDGVFQLKSQQQTNRQDQDVYTLKQYTKTYQAMADFGVEHCYVLGSSLDARGIAASELLIEANVVDELAVSELIQKQDRVFTF